MSDRLVSVTTVADRFEGELLVARLRSEGIDAILYADDAGGTHAPLAHVEPIRIRVQEKDLDAARQILADQDDA